MAGTRAGLVLDMGGRDVLFFFVVFVFGAGCLGVSFSKDAFWTSHIENEIQQNTFWVNPPYLVAARNPFLQIHAAPAAKAFPTSAVVGGLYHRLGQLFRGQAGNSAALNFLNNIFTPSTAHHSHKPPL
jgi:hypothetical protein